jgi:hypothetical protein
MVVLLFEITTSRWRSCVATRHATDGHVTIDGLTGRHSRSSNTAARFALCISNSGNRGMQKDMAGHRKAISNEMYWIFIFVPMMARKI